MAQDMPLASTEFIRQLWQEARSPAVLAKIKTTPSTLQLYLVSMLIYNHVRAVHNVCKVLKYVFRVKRGRIVGAALRFLIVGLRVEKALVCLLLPPLPARAIF